MRLTHMTPHIQLGLLNDLPISTGKSRATFQKSAFSRERQKMRAAQAEKCARASSA